MFITLDSVSRFYFVLVHSVICYLYLIFSRFLRLPIGSHLVSCFLLLSHPYGFHSLLTLVCICLRFWVFVESSPSILLNPSVAAGPERYACDDVWSQFIESPEMQVAQRPESYPGPPRDAAFGLVTFWSLEASIWRAQLLRGITSYNGCIWRGLSAACHTVFWLQPAR